VDARLGSGAGGKPGCGVVFGRVRVGVGRGRRGHGHPLHVRDRRVCQPRRRVRRQPRRRKRRRQRAGGCSARVRKLHGERGTARRRRVRGVRATRPLVLAGREVGSVEADCLAVAVPIARHAGLLAARFPPPNRLVGGGRAHLTARSQARAPSPARSSGITARRRCRLRPRPERQERRRGRAGEG